MVKLLFAKFSLIVRLMPIALSMFLMSDPLLAGSRPATEDAACDDLDRKWTSNQSNIVDRERNFFLFDASDLGCATLVSALLTSGASVEARDRAGNTAFMLASRKGHNAVAEILLKQGSDPHQTNLLGSNALIMAVTHNRRKTVKRLLELGLDTNRSNSNAVTPLVAAAYNGNPRILDLLLDAGANSAAIDSTGKSAIVYAAGRGYLSIVTRLMEHSDSIDTNTRYGNELTVLMWAAGHGNDVPPPDGLAIVEYLLSNGADPNLSDNRGRSALHIAAERGHALIAARLIKAGAITDTKDNNGDTPSALAVDSAIRSILDAQ